METPDKKASLRHLPRDLLVVIAIKVTLLLSILFFVMKPSERPNPRDELGLTDAKSVNLIKNRAPAED